MPESATVTANGIFLNQQLAEYDKTLIRTQYPQAWTMDGLNHVTEASLPLAARRIVATITDQVGKAAIYDGKTIDIPVVEVLSEPVNFVALSFVIGCRWNEYELEMTRLAQQNPGMEVVEPVTERFRAMKEQIDQFAHNIILFGDKARTFRGMLNSSSIPVPTYDNTKKPAVMTDKDLYDWLTSVILNFRINRGLLNSMVYMYVDPQLMKRFNNFLNNGTTQTVATQLTGENGRQGTLAEIREILELDPLTLLAKNVVTAGKGRIYLGAFANKNSAYRRYASFRRTPTEKIPMSFDYGCIGIMSTSEYMYRQPMDFMAIEYNTATV